MSASRLFAAAILAAGLSSGDVRNCACDAGDAARMATRECGLCREAEKMPAEPPVFYLKDVNPRKPNRWLALPRGHFEGAGALASMTPEQRAALWTAAIAKGKEMWGDQWGIAINGDDVRTQCHAHVHIGKLLAGIETSNFVVVNGPAQIPLPRDGTGLWIHPDGARLHVHLGEQITETVLLR